MIKQDILAIDIEAEVDILTLLLKRTIRKKMRRYGAVVGISGGIDSSVVLGLCARALGPENVIGVLLPEKESDSLSSDLACLVAQHFGVTPQTTDITPVLEAFGCYKQRDEAVRRMFPEYDPEQGYTCKITLPPNPLDSDALNFFTLTVVDPAGIEKAIRLPLREYLEIVAASNFKQRARMSVLYHYAERSNYAVVGTANKNEHELGFFVKYGDGGVDIQPILHLFKTQVYRLAAYLGVPAPICERPPTTDTYSARSTQQEFFYQLPFELLDPLWCALEKGLPLADTAELTGLTEIQVQRAWNDINQKKRTTEYLRLRPATILEDIG
jgi:NAD+ synthase